MCIYAYESDAAAVDKFSSVLADVITIIDHFGNHCLALGGDFDVGFNKHKKHTRLLQEVCEVNDLGVATLNNNCSIDFSYNFNMSRFSLYFIVSKNVCACFIDSCSVRHDGDNFFENSVTACKVVKQYLKNTWLCCTQDVTG